MSEIKQELSIRGESIERVYSFYKNNYLLVNRKYQRKLVWNVEEKKAFIDSIICGYPVPLFLFAEVKYNEINYLEIIDGLQRLNAITSYIEQEFDVNDKYFDLETMAESKLSLDNEELIQKFPKEDRVVCTRIASYLLPSSIYKKEVSEEIDEVFRRINSGGKQLSRQDIRQSGSTAHFANIVRLIASKIRGDDSASDRVLLNNIKKISISNKQLEYGINVDDIFWVKQSILPRENVRESRDEEVIADILAYILLPDKPYSNKEMIDCYYGIFSSKINEERYYYLEENILKISPEKIIEQFLYVFEQLKIILSHTPKQFNSLMFQGAGTNVPRYFQSIFLSLYDLLITQEKVITNYNKLVDKLNGIGTYIDVGTGGGGVWTTAGRTKSVDAVTGIIKDVFKNRGPSDPALNSWTTELENLLMQSFTEQTLFEFKQGFHRLDESQKFDNEAFLKTVKTMTAIANQEPNSIGYILIGIANKKEDAIKIGDYYKSEFIEYNKFFITGIQNEALKYHNNLDKYFSFLLDLLKKQPIDNDFSIQLRKDVRLINYYNTSIIIFKIVSMKDPVRYDNDYFIRSGSNTEKLETQNLPSLFRKFYQNLS